MNTSTYHKKVETWMREKDTNINYYSKVLLRLYWAECLNELLSLFIYFSLYVILISLSIFRRSCYSLASAALMLVIALVIWIFHVFYCPNILLAILNLAWVYFCLFVEKKNLSNILYWLKFLFFRISQISKLD